MPEACLLHHQVDGEDSARPLLLLGSLGTTLAMWEPQVRALAGQLRLIRLDLRGHGDSPVPKGPYSIEGLGRDVLATMDRLGLDCASCCGLSIGGMVGMWLAASAPERIERLILICTSARVGGSVYAERAAAVRAAGTPEIVADEVLARWFTPLWAEANGALVARFRAMISGIPAEGYASCCEAVAAADLREELPRISAPTLVVAGAEDSATPPAHGEAIADAVPGAGMVVLDQTAHLASVQRPGAVTELIVDHLAIARRVVEDD